MYGQFSFPQGYFSILSQSLTKEASLGKIVKHDDAQAFSSEPKTLAFAEYFCGFSSPGVSQEHDHVV